MGKRYVFWIIFLLFKSSWASVEKLTQSLTELQTSLVTLGQTMKNLETLSQKNNFVYLFAHGLGGSEKQAQFYINKKIILDEKNCFSGNGPEVKSVQLVFPLGSSEPHEQAIIAQEKVVLGQDADVDVIKTVIKKIPENAEEKNTIIGVGVSKGAATLINAAGVIQDPRLRLLVLESPFADANDVAARLGVITEYIPGGKAFAGSIAGSMFNAYKRTGMQPITSVKNIPKDVVVILMHSKQDKLISIVHSYKLYNEFVKTGHETYLIETETGAHAGVLHGLGGKNVVRIVHAIYKKLDLPFDASLLSVDTDLKKYQPTIEDIIKKEKEFAASCVIS